MHQTDHVHCRLLSLRWRPRFFRLVPDSHPTVVLYLDSQTCTSIDDRLFLLNFLRSYLFCMQIFYTCMHSIFNIIGHILVDRYDPIDSSRSASSSELTVHTFVPSTKSTYATFFSSVACRATQPQVTLKRELKKARSSY